MIRLYNHKMEKRVLYVVSISFAFKRSKAGGFISSGRGVIDGLCQHGYRVDIVTDSVMPGVSENEVKKYHFYRFRLLRKFINPKNRFNVKGALGHLDNLLFRISVRATLKKLLQNNRYDFVYLRASRTGHYAAKLARTFNLPLILEVNKPLSMGRYNQRNGQAWPKAKSQVRVRDYERIQYDVARVITVDSPIRGKWITDFVYSEYSRKMVVNPNAVDAELFRPAGDTAALRKQHGLKADSILVGMASSFRWYNDIDELCEITQQVVRTDRRIIFLLFIGDPQRVQPIQRRIEQNGLAEYVRIYKQVPFAAMPQMLDMCDILISHFNFHDVWPHNCSIKHMEYLAMGKPVVATNAGYVNFAVDDNVNGFLIEQGDVKSFSEAILKLANDEKQREKLGANGREKAEKELTWYKNVDNFLQRL